MHGSNQSMLQNFQILESKTTVSKVECYVCGKGLSEGHSVSAKTVSNGIVLFCDVHYSMQ